MKRPKRYGETIKQNTLLVDGNALFKTGFFGAKTLYNEYGIHIGGVYQFITTLRKLLSEDLYHRVYVFWDGNYSGKLRYEIYEDYKSGRGKNYITGTQPRDESELIQRRVVKEYLNELYIRQLSDEVVEGDDFIAYYCLTKKSNENITICTNDRDMFQLLDDNIRIYFCDNKIKDYVDSLNYFKYFCYNKENAVLVKTVIGDNSDTIKGIKGLGLDSLVKHFPEIKEKKINIGEFINLAKERQDERIENKKKPLKLFDNIINKVTDGIQGNKIYEINERLVNLKKPMMTKNSIKNLDTLKNGTLDGSNRDIGKIYEFMRRDGLDKVIGESRYDNYLTPFKRLIEREKINF